jgi:conjugative relaxase-like TrwC/TraI family protein
MLRITQQSSAIAAKQYYASADYYTEGQELIGRWSGRGAELLGLDGQVDRNAFNRLCENRHPATGRQLTARTKDDRTVGYDFTFSAPKSFSLCQALSGDEALLQAFRDSVKETMRDIEAEMKVRVRKNGRNAERTSGNIAYAEFVHFTSRPVDGVPDPQLHAHVFVFNASYDCDESVWKAGQFRDLKRAAPYWQAAFRARLAKRLQDLGYSLQRKSGDFELSGFAPATLRKFSRRTSKIEDVARERGIDDPEEKARLGALTRERKDKRLTQSDLVREWGERLTDEERKAVLDVAANRQFGPRPEPRDAAAIEFAIQHVFERNAVISEKRLLAEALKHGLGSVSVEGVGRALRAAEILVREHDGQRMATTPEVVQEEDRLVRFARDGRGTRRPLGEPGRTIHHEKLNVGQRNAVRHILGSRDRVILVRGAPGTGKTTLMKEAVEAIQDGGHHVVVLAPTASASRDVLRREGFKQADTVAAFLVNQEQQQAARGQVLWVDEAGLLGNRDMGALFAVAERVDARVVLMGDRAQHGSPARGSPLRLLENEAGVKSVSVTEIVRQQGEYRRAVELLAKGNVAEGFDALDRLGWIQEAPESERYRILADAYLSAVSETKPGGTNTTALIVSPTHAEAERITQEVRRLLAERGRLGEERIFTSWVPMHLTEAERREAESYQAGDMVQFQQNAPGVKRGQRLTAGVDAIPFEQAARFQAYRPAALSIAVGDRIRVTANGQTADGRHRLVNGSLHGVAGFTPTGDIALDNGWVVSRRFGHIAHGVVVTSHASQGRTVDRVLVGQSRMSLPATTREQLLVSVSRGRDGVTIFTDDKAALRQAVARGAEPLTAREVFRRRKPVGRERLRRHLAHLRRLASDLWPRMTVHRPEPVREVFLER